MTRSAVIKAADLFCGGGGTSEGLARACARSDRKLDLVAVNHWDIAIETHRKNHPHARHVLAPLEGVNPRDLVPRGRLNLLVASPECTDHSQAKGGRPKNDQSRASAWLILKWLQELYVEAFLIENVKEFTQWGPLGADGRPLKSRRGVLFTQFIADLKALGYNVEWRVLNAANYGDPTTRERLFIIGRRGRNKKITWPGETHAANHLPRNLFGDRKPWRAAREIIDWTVPGRSIFARKRPLAMNTLKRILAGMQKFKWPEPFLIVLRNHMDARSIDEPMPTITAGGQHVGICQPFVLGQQSNAAPRSTDSPLPTVATAGSISLVQPFVVPFFGERKDQAPRVHSLDEPLPAVTSHGAGAIVEPFIMTASHGEGDRRRCKSIDEPMPTVTGANDHGVVSPMIVKFDHQGGNGGRARSIDSPLPTITTKNGLAVVEPFVAELRKNKTAKSIDEPLSTVTTKGAHHAVVEPFIVPQFGQSPAKSVAEPLGTITTTSRGVGLVQPEAFITKFYGTGTVADINEPLDTVTVRERFGLCQIGDTLYDIHFRMLRPRELARAQGFPDSYQFIGGNAEVTKMVGNAVPVGVAEALCSELLK